MQCVSVAVVRAFSLELGLPEDVIRTAVQRMGIIVSENIGDGANNHDMDQ